MIKQDKSLLEIQENIRVFCDDRNWDQFHNPKDLSISLSLEAAELLEHFQWKNEAEVADYLQLKKGEIADEVVDILYWILLIANKLDIDLVDAFDKKMIKNAAKYPVEKAMNSSKKYTEL